MFSIIIPFVSSLVYSQKRRAVTETLPSRLGTLWKEWDLRVLILLSLTLQVVLIILGNRRKYVHRLWIRIVVWSAYLAADYVATCTLGVLSSNLADSYGGDARSLDANVELTALWAPFLLLHLGGPDTITAYAFEDNELWLRHLLGLVSQTVTTVYVFHMAWTGSYLSILFILLFISGLIKYGERIWVLRSATAARSMSNNKIRESGYSFSSACNSNFAEEKRIKVFEGYKVDEEKVIEIRHPIDLSVLENKSIQDEDKLLTAYRLLNLTKSFLFDVTLGSRDNTKSVFRNMTFKNAFEVIEMQLGLTYDLLYTKAPLFYTPWGIILHLISFFLTCSVLVLFTFLHHKHKYSNIDFSITLLLLIVAIVLEIYAALVLLFSDQFVIWLTMHNKTSTLQALSCFPPLFKTPRWSNNMPQFSLLSFSMKIKTPPCYKILKLLTIVDESLEKRCYIDYKKVPGELTELIFSHLRSKSREHYLAPSTTDVWQSIFVGNYPKYWDELVISILFLHIVTEVLYYTDEEDVHKKQSDADLIQHWKSSKQISGYMMYLLVMHSPMFSTGMNQISFQETVDEAARILPQVGRMTKLEACRKLTEIHGKNQRDPNLVNSSDSSVLSHSLNFADKLNERYQQKEKWEKICKSWLDILTYAACKCKGNQHAQQLRKGGEFLTHVWLLMANSGLTDHFQITEEYQIVRVIAKAHYRDEWCQ